MNVFIAGGSALRGTLALPADKAICHRAVLLSSLTGGSTQIRPWSTAEDCQRTAAILQQLGVSIASRSDGIYVEGVGLSGLRPPNQPLDCGESGTTMRLAAGLLAGQPFVAHLSAQGSLQQRPMRRIVEPLTQMGVQIDGTRRGGEELYPPLKITGRRPLRGLTYVPRVASAQAKSAVLLAGLFADQPTTILEPVPTRDHTERLLGRLGVTILRKGNAMTLEPPRRPLQAAGILEIPGDVSSAAFLIVAAAICPGSRLTIQRLGLNPTRLHIIHVLQRMGAAIRYEPINQDWEPWGTLTVEHHPLRGVTISSSEVVGLIDELPILMVAACAAESDSRLEGLGELRVKETDRLHAMTTGLRQLGAAITPQGEAGVFIHPSRLRGASLESFNDHRTAMSLAIAGLAAEGRTEIRNAQCVAKSFGGFFDLLASLTPPATVQTTAWSRG